MEKSVSNCLSQMTRVKQQRRLPGAAGAFDVLKDGASPLVFLPNMENPSLDLRQTLDKPQLRNIYKRPKFSESSRSPKPGEPRESVTGQKEPEGDTMTKPVSSWVVGQKWSPASTRC